MGAILESVTATSFEALLKQRIVEPLRLKNTGIARRNEIVAQRAQDYVPSESGWQRGPIYYWQSWHAAGAMISTVNDLRRWNQALIGDELVSASSARLMFTPRTDVGSTGNYVGFGSWIYPRRLTPGGPRPTVIERRGAIGGFTALNVVLKEENCSLVLLANCYNEQIHQLPWGASLPFDFLRILYGLEAQGPPAE